MYSKNLDLKTENILGFEIFLENVPEPRKKIREGKSKFVYSDFQRVVRDFAFVIDEKFSSNEIVNLVRKIDGELIGGYNQLVEHFNDKGKVNFKGEVISE